MVQQSVRGKWGDGLSDEAVQRFLDSLVYHGAGSAVSVEIESSWKEVSPDVRVSPDGRRLAIRPYLLLRGRR